MRTVAEVYKNQNVLLTGGTGYMGKVFIEKLLRSCPDLGTLYILIRDKHGQTKEQRWKEIVGKALFDRIKAENATVFDKVVLINGDLKKLNLGLSDADANLLRHNVNVIFNFAANVKFTMNLNEAIIANVRSTRDLCHLALEMDNLTAFVHVSTAFSQCHQRVELAEEVYPPYADWRQMIEIAERMDVHQLNLIHPHILGQFPNTYTFSKGLAENCLADLLEGRARTVIVRPSYVMPTLEEPFTGWFEDIMGPIGALVAGMLGVGRIAYGNKEVAFPWIPVDFTVKTCIASVWKKVEKTTDEIEANKVDVYNSSVDKHLQKSGTDVIDLGLDIVENVGLTYMVWYPASNGTTSYTKFYIYNLIFHVIPCVIFDAGMWIIGRKPFMYNMLKKAVLFNHVVYYFGTRSWPVSNAKTMRLVDELLDEDKETWGFHMNYVDRDLGVKFLVYAKKLLLNDTNPFPRFTRIRIRFMYYLDKLVGYLFYALLAYFLIMLYLKLN